LLGACSGGTDDSTTQDGLSFHGEAKLLEGFKFDTGPQPSSGPVKLSLRLTASGSDVVDARGDVAGGKLVPRAGTGTLALDAHFKLEGTLKIDSTLKKYEGDIPGLKNIDVPATGNATFDPFLLEGAAQVDADIPETKLPDIPLGGVPGHLSLTIMTGSKLTTKYEGTCMTVAGGSAQYEGTATTSGTLLIKATVVVDLPSPLDKEVALPTITVPVPSMASKVAFAAVAANGAGDETSGKCQQPTEDAGTDTMGDSEPDTATTDTGTVATDTSTPPTDTGTPPGDTDVGDTSTDTSTDTRPTCTSESSEPDGTEASARVLTAIDDCDGSGSTITGTSSGNEDLDVLKYEGKDSSLCSAYPYAKITSGAVTVCVKPVCKVGKTTVGSCTKGTLTAGACCGTEAEAVFNCEGTTAENATVYMTVKPNASVAGTCSTYALAYHY
jgi:hypothetical protein